MLWVSHQNAVGEPETEAATHQSGTVSVVPEPVPTYRVVLAVVQHFRSERMAGPWCLAALCPDQTPLRPHAIDTSVGVVHVGFRVATPNRWTFCRVFFPHAAVSPGASRGGPGRFALGVIHLFAFAAVVVTTVCWSYGIAACSRTSGLFPCRAGSNRTLKH